MPVTTQPERQSTAVLPDGARSPDRETVLGTLALHATAINTILEQLFALEAKLGVSPAGLRAEHPALSSIAGEASITGPSSGNRECCPTDHRTAEDRALEEEVSKIKWFHSIDLGHGIVTPGYDRCTDKLAAMQLPDSLEGMTFLDIGAWDGFYSFAAERRGARRVLATDSYVWQNKTWGSKAGFDLAKRVLKSKVDEMEIDAMDLSPERIGTFDVVLFAGVLYHLRHPLLALERVFSVTKQLLVLVTHVDLPQIKRPVMAFYPHDELRHDATNWWGPNTSCVLSMLESVGFRNARVVSECDPGNASSSPEEITYGWVVVHADR